MIKTINWNGKELHTIEWKVSNEIEWCFFGKEIVSILNYKLDAKTTSNKYVKKYCDEDEIIEVKSKELLENLNPSELGGFEIGRKGEQLLLETGVYSLILSSPMEEAKEFKRFVKKLLKQLREKAGLEQYEAFRMMDKQVQLNVQKIVAEIGDLDNGGKNCIVMNNNVNKLISCELFGFDKPLTKGEMETHAKMMLIDRQEVLTKYADYILVCDGSHRKAYEMTTKWIKFKYGHLLAS